MQKSPFPLLSISCLLLTLILSACTAAAPSNPLGTRDVPPTDKIVVVEYSDFNCPACKSAYPVAREVKRMSDVYFELRHYPLPIPGHETSAQAASAYECGAEQGLGDEFANALFENQGKDEKKGFTDEFLVGLPVKYGFDKRPGFEAAKYATCFADGTYKDKVATDKLSAQKAEVTGTPSFIVNGKPMLGARELMEAIEAERSKLGKAAIEMITPVGK
jgi:protein-disulfide isomerase